MKLKKIRWVKVEYDLVAYYKKYIIGQTWYADNSYHALFRFHADSKHGFKSEKSAKSWVVRELEKFVSRIVEE